MEMAPALVGATRGACRAYIGYFFRHWAHRKAAHDDVLDVYVDNFLKPRNLEGGFAHYKASHAGRVAMIKGEAPELPRITTPTCVRWAEHDPIFPYAWTDRLCETFAELDLAPFPGIGDFPQPRGSRPGRPGDRRILFPSRLALTFSHLRGARGGAVVGGGVFPNRGPSWAAPASPEPEATAQS